MTTYRKDVKKEHALLKNSDTLSLYQNEVRGHLHAAYTRTNCLVGFTVISILIGSAALAISTLLLLQKIMVVEDGKYEALQMRVKYLERLTESFEQEYLKKPCDNQPIPPQSPPQPTQEQQPLPPLPPTLNELPPPPLSPQPPPQPPTLNELPPPPQPLPSPRSPRPPYPPSPPTQPPPPSPLPTPPAPEARDYDYPDLGIKPPALPEDDEDAGVEMEGSGDDCPLNPPRPICPIGMTVCTTKERCPKYVCCR